jgi:hypothetical protein
VALVVLLVNDHLLKGGGILPGWLTGKLSDFAFLVVLPVLVASLMPARLLGRRTAAFAIVIGIFVAAKVSLSASNALVICLARVGIRWQMQPDPSDLIALLILPMSWRIANTRSTHTKVIWRRALQLIGMLVGAAACIATETADPLPPCSEDHSRCDRCDRRQSHSSDYWIVGEAAWGSDGGESIVLLDLVPSFAEVRLPDPYTMVGGTLLPSTAERPGQMRIKPDAGATIIRLVGALTCENENHTLPIRITVYLVAPDYYPSAPPTPYVEIYSL